MSQTAVEASAARPGSGPKFDDSGIGWRHFDTTGLEEAERKSIEPLSYWVLGVDQKAQVVDILFRMEPGAMCAPHVHVGRTTTFVVEGEHRNLTLTDGSWTVAGVRAPGVFVISDGDHFHREQAGPDGVIIHLSMTAVDGVVWLVTDDAGQVRAEARLEDFLAAQATQSDPHARRPRRRSGL